MQSFIAKIAKREVILITKINKNIAKSYKLESNNGKMSEIAEI